MDVRPKLIELLQQTRDEERRFVDQLAPEERQRVGDVNAWSAKDLIAHLAAWKLRMADRLDTAHQGGTRSEDVEPDAENSLIWAEYAGKSWEEVLQALAQGHQRLIDSLQALSGEELHDPQRFEWQSGQPLWRGVAGNGCTHPIMHLADAYVKRGEAAYGAAMMEDVSEALALLDATPRWRGVVRYNLACYFALAGDKARAIGILRDALRLHPGLTEWSKEDTDLACLHGQPEYEGLYAA